MKLKDAFIKLREEWFNQHLMSYAHERVSEDDEETKYRENNNKHMRAQYDRQTEAIIQGADKPFIAPTCGYDLDRGEIK